MGKIIGIDLVNTFSAVAQLDDTGREVIVHNDAGENVTPRKFQGTSRTVGVGSQILANLGVSKMRLLSSQTKYHSLSGFGLEVVEYIAD